jgi:hypothetical protein
MSVSSLALHAAWRDYWAMWSPFVEPWISPIEKSLCHAPRLAVMPELLNSVFPPGGKMLYNFHLIPGSIIWGMWPFLTPGINKPGPSIQLTDVGLGHAFFQEPIRADQISTTGPAAGYFPSFTLLPSPHPVVGDGLFTFEAWGQPGSTFVMLLGVAEVTDCPVR